MIARVAHPGVIEEGRAGFADQDAAPPVGCGNRCVAVAVGVASGGVIAPIGEMDGGHGGAEGFERSVDHQSLVLGELQHRAGEESQLGVAGDGQVRANQHRIGRIEVPPRVGGEGSAVEIDVGPVLGVGGGVVVEEGGVQAHLNAAGVVGEAVLFEH